MQEWWLLTSDNKAYNLHLQIILNNILDFYSQNHIESILRLVSVLLNKVVNLFFPLKPIASLL